MKDLSKIIKEFEKFPYKSYETMRPKNEPTDSYFYPARYLEKCMMRASSLNLNIYPERTEMTGTKHITNLHVCSTKKSEPEELLVD